jgi:hypothetical protein
MNSTYKSLRGASPKRAKARLVLASTLSLGSPDQIELIHSRIARDACLECGSAERGSDGYYCCDCLSKFPIVTEVGSPFDGWRYEVAQIKPAYDQSAFLAQRVGIFERESQGVQVFGYLDTFREAKAAVVKKRDRALAMPC